MDDLLASFALVVCLPLTSLIKLQYQILLKFFFLSLNFLLHSQLKFFQLFSFSIKYLDLADGRILSVLNVSYYFINNSLVWLWFPNVATLYIGIKFVIYNEGSPIISLVYIFQWLVHDVFSKSFCFWWQVSFLYLDRHSISHKDCRLGRLFLNWRSFALWILQKCWKLASVSV